MDKKNILFGEKNLGLNLHKRDFTRQTSTINMMMQVGSMVAGGGGDPQGLPTNNFKKIIRTYKKLILKKKTFFCDGVCQGGE